MNRFENITMRDVQKHNDEYYAERPEWRLSESRPFDESAMRKFIEEIRPNYQYVDEYCPGHWEKLQITKSRSKYGTNFIYYDKEQKLWRTTQTAAEFYGW